MPSPVPIPATPRIAPLQAPNITPRSTPRVLATHGTNSIIAPGFGDNAGDGTNSPLTRLTSNPTSGAAASQTVPGADEPTGMINFQGVSLDQVLQHYAELVGRTVLRPANLAAQQQIVLKTQTQLTKAEAIQALDAVLQLNGVAMINVGEKFVKAVLVPAAAQEGQAFSKVDASQLPDLGQYTTHVVQLRYAKPSELMPALQPFAKAPNPILPIDSSQILVLRDFAENVKRMLELIKEIDVAVPSEFISEVIPIKYALASDISAALNGLGTGGGGATVGGSGASGSRAGTGSSFGRSGSSSSSSGRSGFGSSYPGQMNNPMGMNTGMGGTTPGASGSFSDRLQQIIKRASVTGEINVIGETKIIADERTNALLIFASREDMKMIKEVVAKLDVVLAQVLIEALIIEVNLGDDRSMGVTAYFNGPNSGDFSGAGVINRRLLRNAQLFPIGGTNDSGGGDSSGLSFFGSIGKDFDFNIRALVSDTRARILQRPRIQTSHGVPATLFVGESRPYPMGSYYGGGSYGGYSSIQQIQIGVTLEVTPLINPEGLVVMDIHQKVESANGSVKIDNIGDVPITSQKDAVATVAVRDGDTIMLGGLIYTDKDKSASGVPYLKDIPVLGYLFRSSKNSESRRELIVLIRPTVLPTPEIAALAAKAEKDKMPEVSRAEAEVAADELRRHQAAERSMETERLREESRAKAKTPKEKNPASDPRFAPVEGL